MLEENLYTAIIISFVTVTAMIRISTSTSNCKTTSNLFLQRKQFDTMPLEEEASLSIRNFLIRTIDQEVNTNSKCITLVTDEYCGARDHVLDIESRINVPVIVLAVSDVRDKRFVNYVENDKTYIKMMTLAVNQNCNFNIICVKFKTTAEKIARLLIRSEKLAIVRNPRKYFVFVPVELKEIYSLSNSFHNESIIQNGANISLNYINCYDNESTVQNALDRPFITWKGTEESSVQYENLQCDKYTFDSLSYVGSGSFTNDLTSVFCLKEMDLIPDVIVLRWSSKIEFNPKLELVTNIFRYRHPNVTLSILCTWNGIEFLPTNCEPFPDKLSNLHKRELQISTFSWYFPYITMKFLDGTENKLIQVLAHKMNFTYKFKISKVWGTFQPNGTGKGIHRDLLVGISDIGIGGIFLVYDNALYFDFTTPYLLNGITMLVPRPKPLPLWLSIIAPFSLHLWLLVIASAVMGSLALYLCALVVQGQTIRSPDGHTYADIVRCFLTVIGLLTQMSTNRWPSEASLRHLLTWQFIFFYLVMTGYKSSLINFLRYTRYEKTIDTAEEFTSKTDLYWTAVDESWPKLLSSFVDSSLRKIHSRYKRYPNVNVINKELPKGDLAIAVENLATGGYSGADYIDKDFIAKSMWLMPSDLSTTMVAMELERGSPYIEHFNAIIHSLVESGFIRQWEIMSWMHTDQWRRKLKTITMTKFGLTKQAACDPAISMKLLHLRGVFLLLGFGMSISILAFILEIRCKNNLNLA